MRRIGNQKIDNKLFVIPVKAGAEIEAGKLVAIDATGHAVEAIKAAGLTVAGMCQEYVTNVGGTDGAVIVKVRRGAFVLGNNGDVAVTDLLKTAYITDSETVTLVSDASSAVGKIIEVDSETVTVDIQ